MDQIPSDSDSPFSMRSDKLCLQMFVGIGLCCKVQSICGSGKDTVGTVAHMAALVAGAGQNCQQLSQQDVFFPKIVPWNFAKLFFRKTNASINTAELAWEYDRHYGLLWTIMDYKSVPKVWPFPILF